MNKQIISVLAFAGIIVLIIFSGCSPKHGNFSKNLKKHERKMLDMAFVTGDVPMAIQSTQAILLLDSANLGLMDTLVNLYMKINDYGSAYFTSGRILEIDSTNVKAIEARAKTASLLNKAEEAIEYFTKLYDKEPDTRFLYEIAVQNFNLGNIEKGEEELQEIMDNPQSRTDLYTYRVQGGQIIQVPVLAVVYYFYGTYKETQEETGEAMEYLGKSLEVYPNYGLAANKLKELSKE